MTARQKGIGFALLLFLMPAACSQPGEDNGSVPAIAEAGIQVVPDVVYGRKLGLALTFDVYRPARSTGAAVLFINSGGFVSGQIVQYDAEAWGRPQFRSPGELSLMGQSETIPLLDQFSFADLLEAGITVLDVRHGGSPQFKLTEMVDDLEQAARFVTAHAADLSIDPGRIGGWGASSGGYLALWLACGGDSGDPGTGGAAPRTGSRFAAAAVYYPTGYDLVEIVERYPELLDDLPALRIDRAELERLSLRSLISSDDPSTFIVYGTDDYPFITAPSESVHAALTRFGVESRLVPIPGTGHEFRGADGYHAGHGDSARAAVASWFAAKLAPR